MSSPFLRRLVVALVVLGLPFLPAPPAAAQDAPTLAQSGAMAYAVTTDGQLALIGLEAPEAEPLELAPITGLRPGDVVRTIDVDPVDGALVAVADGSDGGTRSYVLDTDPSRFGAAVEIAAEGPADDLDIDPCTGARAGLIGSVFPPGDASSGSAQLDGVARLPAVRLLGGALCTTRSFVVDAARDVLAVDLPAAPGVLRTVGSIGRDIGTVVGFDIDAGRAGLLATSPSSPSASASASATQARQARPPLAELFWVDLASGRLTPIGWLLFGVLAVALALLGLLLPPVPQVPLHVLLPALLLAGGAVELIRSRRRDGDRFRPLVPNR